MSIIHLAGVKPPASAIELGRGADGIVLELLDHPELVVKDMNHRFKLGRNRIALERRVLHAVLDATKGADVSRIMLPDPTFDNVRWGYTEANPEPRWILIDP